MKLPLNASQTIAVVAVTAVLLAGAYALGRSQDGKPPAAAELAVDSKAGKAESRAVEAKSKVQQPALNDEPAPLARLCNECSRVVSVRSEQRQGQGSGLGAIGGAVLGGLLGNQIGGGTGKQIATVGGAVAGGMAGNEVEKRSKSERVWVIRLAHKDGSTQTHEQRDDPQLQAGDVVVLREGQLQRR
jgi:outer membrane lipoprotein SlyB